MKPDKITEAAPGSEDAQNAHDNGCSCGSAEHAGVPSPECTLKQARLVKFQRDGKNVIYSLSDDHVYTMLAQGMTHICE